MAGLTIEPFPSENSLTRGPNDPRISGPWSTWLELALVSRVQASSPNIVSPAITPGQSASVGATDLITQANGRYRVNWTLAITQAATTSSSISVSITTTLNTSPSTQTAPVPAVTGNTTSTIQSGILIVTSDANTPLTYSTTYASVGATPMKYTLTLDVESIA